MLSSSLTYTLLSSLLSFATLTRSSPIIPRDDKVVARIKVNLPEYSTYEDWLNPKDFVWGGDQKEITFTQAQVDDPDFKVKFHFKTWEKDTGGQNYINGHTIWNMVCYASSSLASPTLVPAFTLHDDKANPITRDSPGVGKVWCPAAEGRCPVLGVNCPNIDSVVTN